MRDIISKVEKRVRELMYGEASGHDWYHVDMVRKTALKISNIEGGDRDLIELIALVHDVGDRKLHASEEAGKQVTKDVLIEGGAQPEIVERVLDIVNRLSFKGAGLADDMPILEGKIVQDADRLCALGAVGIGRTFAYGGAKGRLMYDPSVPVEHHDSKEKYHKSNSPTINHFYEKLLLLKDRMNTQTAKHIAEGRHAFMEEFLKRFMAEWDAKD